MLTNLLCGAEVLTLYWTYVKKLGAYMMRHLRDDTWKDKITNDENLHCANYLGARASVPLLSVA